MRCKAPFVGRSGAYGCKQCRPCRVNSRRIWTFRILLEQLCHEKSSFVTLTYDDDHLPPGGTLVRKHEVKWKKRMGRALGAGALRFFVVGEYGDVTQRPHYHVAVFGGGCAEVDLCREYRRLKAFDKECEFCQTVRRSWPHGSVIDVGDLNRYSAGYIAGYVTKKMNKESDPRPGMSLNGRYKEYAQPSLKPGIGALAVSKIVDVLTSENGCEELRRVGDVPSQLKYGNKLMPLGRYLRKKIRETYGITEEESSKIGQKKMQQVLQELYEGYAESPWSKEDKYTPDNERRKFFLVEKFAQKVLQLETRLKIYDKPRRL